MFDYVILVAALFVLGAAGAKGLSSALSPRVAQAASQLGAPSSTTLPVQTPATVERVPPPPPTGLVSRP